MSGRSAAILVASAACLGAVLLASGRPEARALKTYEIELDNAFGLVEGGDFRIGGVRAGQTTGFRITRTDPYRTIVTAEVTEPGFDALRTDARCDVRQQSLIGEYFVDCDVGTGGRRLPDGGRIPVERTSSTIPPDLINNVMRRPYRERFRLIVAELGTGLAGRPRELNEVVRRAHPALRELTQTLAILRRQNTVLRDFIRDADTIQAAVEPVKEDVARWANEASQTAAIQASRAEQLRAYWHRLPDFLAELEPTMAELERTASFQIPTLEALRRAAPGFERFLRAAAPFARATRGAIDDLGDAAATGSTAVTESREEIRELRELAAFLPRLGKPLRQFLQSMDDRRRSIENNPSLRRVTPPPPDKTAYRDGQGHTGMEAFWRQIFSVALHLNLFDEFGHLQRITLLAGGPCRNYNTDPTPEQIERCSSWLGPYQPGITHPDPTPAPAAEAATDERRGAGAAPRRRPAAGDPEAPPRPGGHDHSEPQIVLPEGVRELLERLPLPPLSGLPTAPPRAARPDGGSYLLDYLLGP